MKTKDCSMFSAMGNRLVTGLINKVIKYSKKPMIKNHINRDDFVSQHAQILISELAKKNDGKYSEVYDTAVRECLYWYIESDVEWDIELELR